MQRQLCFTARFRLESYLKYGTGAGHTLGGQPYSAESRDFTRCIINSPTLKEGCTTHLEEITFTHVDGFKGSGVEGNIKLPACHVE